MVFRVCISAALLFVVVLVAGAGLTPVQAASSDISYNEIVKIVMGQSAPAPGSYKNGSFDADWQSAQPAKASSSHGLFAAFNQMKSALSSLSNGTPSTYYYLANMEREDDITGQTGTITLPDKAQYIHLNFANKTYWITSPNTAQTYVPPVQQQPGPQGTMPPSQPGTSKVTITVSTTSLGSKNLGGVDTDGYQLTFKIVSSQATGSCTNGTFQTTMTEFVSRYAEPSIHWPVSVTKLPHMAMPRNTNPETASFKPGCVPKATTRVHIGPTAPSGRLVMWELLTINGSAQAQQGAMSGGFSTLIERGDVKDLSSGDSSLFGPPAGFTQQTSTP